VRRPSALVTTAITLAAVTLLACGAKPQRSTVSDGTSPGPAASDAANAPPTAQLGQTITLTGGIGDNEISVTAFSAKSFSSAPDNALVKPQKGVYLTVRVEVRVVRGKTYACICDFALVAGDGSLFEPVWPIGFHDGMSSVTLNSGEKTAGVIVFDLPKSARDGATFQLRPDWTNDVRGTWKL
jgi:hypothetical protein